VKDGAHPRLRYEGGGKNWLAQCRFEDKSRAGGDPASIGRGISEEVSQEIRSEMKEEKEAEESRNSQHSRWERGSRERSLTGKRAEGERAQKT